MVSDLALGGILVALFGAAVGSFLNVVILRTHDDRQWWSGRSRCPHCGHELSWYEMFPVLSFVLLRGHCRHCRTRLSRQYLAVEVLTALAFLLVYLSYHSSATTVIGWMVVGAMILLAVYDARWSLLPDSFSIVFAVFATILSWALHRTWLDILIGGLLGAGFFAAQFVVSRKRWVGSGDILLGAGLGLLLGWRSLALALFIAYMVGALVAAFFLLTRRLKPTSTMAFGPYLLSAGLIAWLWGDRIVDWYFRHALFR